MIKYRTKKVIELEDWNHLVETTYGRPYHLQQQEGCMERQQIHLEVPSIYTNDDEMNDSIPEEVNGDEMGVKFAVWLARDPKQTIPDQGDNDWRLRLFWERNFYPDLYAVANDLWKKGLIEAGEYYINIDY